SKPISIDPRLGIEGSYKNSIFLRAGIGNFYRVMDNADTTNQRKYTVFQPSVGVGFKIKSLSIDYAFTSLQVQDNPLMSHIVSVRVDLLKANTKRRIEEEKRKAERAKRLERMKQREEAAKQNAANSSTTAPPQQ